MRARLTKLFSTRLPFSTRVPSIGRGKGVVGILSADDNASVRYFIGAHIARQWGSNIETVFLTAGNAQVGYEAIVIARYLPKAWIAPLQRFRAAGGRVVYFMDDDLMDPAATLGLPRTYVKKIRTLAMTQRHTLTSLCDAFWVSSAFLAEKYAVWSPEIVLPSVSASELDKPSTTTVCYHGTASHIGELDWLVPVIDEVQRAQAGTRFEIFGDHAVNRMYREIPGVSVLHPMSWTNYLAYTASVHNDIGLAPLLPQPFNLGRGPTKFFDFARMGAVGIYTDVAPYRDFVRNGIDGVLLANDAALWAQTIIDLASDESRRRRMADAARKRAFQIASDAGSNVLKGKITDRRSKDRNIESREQ